jgi:hypothetical protein
MDRSPTISALGEDIALTNWLLGDGFCWRLSISIFLGYLLATIPQTILDPLFTSHVAYGSRRYPLAWLIAPIAVLLLISTQIILVSMWRHRFPFALLPFAIACCASIPIFKPEMPHGNLLFISALWLAVSSITLWIHQVPTVDPTLHLPVPSSAACIDFIKEQTAIWKACSLGLTAAYLSLVITLVKELHSNNALIVKSQRDLFLLNTYSNVEVALASLLILFGPIYESLEKVMQTNRLLLSIR